MAIKLCVYSSPPPCLTLSYVSVKGVKNNSRLLLISASASKHNISVDLAFRSPDLRKKVYEDPSAGIVCYRGEDGEITCEGYDEGPRFGHQTSSGCSTRYSREDVDGIGLLRRCWFQVTGANADGKTLRAK